MKKIISPSCLSVGDIKGLITNIPDNTMVYCGKFPAVSFNAIRYQYKDLNYIVSLSPAEGDSNDKS